MTPKIALVTGATRGIGAAIATRLHADGYTVIGTATRQSGADQISQRGQIGVVLDVCNAEQIDTVLADITKQHGSISVLVNNAGITRDTLLLRMKDEDWQAVLDTNLSAVFRLSKRVVRDMMKARFGRIISIGSVVGSMGNGGQANYAAAKAGLSGFSRALAKEVGSRGITVNVIAPGYIQTDMTDGLDEALKAKLLEQIPAARLGQPEDIADAVAWLASSGSGYLTGETLHVNGGLYMSA
jgi:3-oxoacyl-[acyl-carrier protein] reductase